MMSAFVGLDHPAWLLLLPLAWLPLRTGVLPAWQFSSVALVPVDRASVWVARLLKVLGVLAFVATVLALAGPYLPAYEIERTGKGAEVVLLLDRSLSMDQPMASEGKALTATPGGRVLGFQRPLGDDFKSKGKAARDVLSEFVAQRESDRFGMVVFSSLPMHVLDFTEKQSAVQAAIAAGYVGKGLSETDVGAALLQGLALFDNRAYTGSRLLLLVSDGGDHLHPDIRDQLTALMRRQRVSLYWIYLRSFGSEGLLPGGIDRDEDKSEATPGDGATVGGEDHPIAGDALPERSMHRFFKGLGIPYRAYEAENPDALRRAVADVNRLENLPITYAETIARRDLGAACLALALGCLALLCGASFMGTKSWR